MTWSSVTASSRFLSSRIGAFPSSSACVTRSASWNATFPLAFTRRPCHARCWRAQNASLALPKCCNGNSCRSGSSTVLTAWPFETCANSEALASVISMGLDDAQRADALGRRGHEYSVSIERTRKFPDNYEELFADVIKRLNKGHVHDSSIMVSVTERFTWTLPNIGLVAAETAENC